MRGLGGAWPALRIFLWTRLAIWALAAGTAGVWLRRNRWYLGVKRWVTGIVFVGLGVSSTRAA